MCIRDREGHSGSAPVGLRGTDGLLWPEDNPATSGAVLSLIHISEPTPEQLVCRLLLPTRVRSSAASDVYKRQGVAQRLGARRAPWHGRSALAGGQPRDVGRGAVSYTHLRAHETPEHLVCRL